MRAIGIGQRATHPSIPVGVEPVVPAYRGRELAHSLVNLNAAVDGVLLVPQQTAIDVHVFERECVLRSNQRWERSNLDVSVLAGLQLHEGNGNGAKEIRYRFIGLEKRGAQGWNVIGARLKVELEPSICFLDEDLPVAQAGLLSVVTRNVIILHHA